MPDILLMHARHRRLAQGKSNFDQAGFVGHTRKREGLEKNPNEGLLWGPVLRCMRPSGAACRLDMDNPARHQFFASSRTQGQPETVGPRVFPKKTLQARACVKAECWYPFSCRVPHVGSIWKAQPDTMIFLKVRLIRRTFSFENRGTRPWRTRPDPNIPGKL